MKFFEWGNITTLYSYKLRITFENIKFQLLFCFDLYFLLRIKHENINYYANKYKIKDTLGIMFVANTTFDFKIKLLFLLLLFFFFVVSKSDPIESN